MRILNTIGPVFSKEAKKILDSAGKVDYLNIVTQEQLQDRIGNYEIAVIGLGLNYDKKIIDAGKKLRIIATASTGTDHIDLRYAQKKGIKVLCYWNSRVGFFAYFAIIKKYSSCK